MFKNNNIKKLSVGHHTNLLIKQFCVNFTYVSDEDKWGVADHWEISKKALEDKPWTGDCETFARTAKKKFPEVFKDWDLIVCESVRGGHAFLRHPSGFIFDNMSALYFSEKLYFMSEKEYRETKISIKTEKKVSWFLMFGKLVNTHIVNKLIFLTRTVLGNDINEPIFKSKNK